MNDFAVPDSNGAGANFKKALLCLYDMTAPPSRSSIPRMRTDGWLSETAKSVRASEKVKQNLG